MNQPHESSARSRKRRVPAHAACSAEALAARMLTVVGDATLREVATDCGIHRETARRYLHGATPPSLVFIAVFADRYDVSLEWLLCGRGPMYRSMLRQHHLGEASIRDVCLALGAGVERALGQRISLADEVAGTASRVRWRTGGATENGSANPKLSLDPVKTEAR